MPIQFGNNFWCAKASLFSFICICSHICLFRVGFFFLGVMCAHTSLFLLHIVSVVVMVVVKLLLLLMLLLKLSYPCARVVSYIFLVIMLVLVIYLISFISPRFCSCAMCMCIQVYLIKLLFRLLLFVGSVRRFLLLPFL